ncbi:ABC transporter permease [Candidatus Izimaplasma bacterium]|nr:ABC transporter permease [Candidatus Izimaplasma bacterium]
MNIYKFELKMLIKSMVVWSLGISAGLMFYVSFYPLMATDTDAFNQLMADFPPEFLAFFGMGGELSFSSLIGYFVLTFGMIQIPIAIQAANYGLNMLSVEERELTADFLLSKPIKRSTIFFSKLLASLTSLTVVNIAVSISSITILLIFQDETLPWKAIILLLSSTVFFQLFFVGTGMLISVSVKKIRSVMPFSMALGFGLYIINSLGEMFTSNLFKVFSPYGHFKPGYIIVEGSYHIGFTIVSFCVIIGTLVASYFLYLRRNIASL